MIGVQKRGRAVRGMHWLDAMLAAAVVLSVASAVVGYGVMRRTEPKIDAIEPATIAPQAARVRLRGRDFRPFLQAFVVPAGTPFVLHDAASGFQPAPFYLASARDAELDVPALAPGTYDLYLYDQGRRVTVVSSALKSKASAPPHSATIAATVRFLVPAEMLPLVRVGDRDAEGSTGGPADGRAVVRQLAALPRPVETVDFEQIDPSRYAGAKTSSRAIDATVSIPVTQRADGAWTYKGAAVRAGEDFTLVTNRYVAQGLTLDVERSK
jgi:hypothetical protein